MAYNGSGVFVRIYNWVQDKTNGIKIRADRMDAEMDGFATGLSNAITKDGQTTITANLPMAGFKHTGVGVAAARTEYLRASQLQDNELITFTATGTDTYAITPVPAVASYTTGQEWKVIFTNANTTAATLNVNGLGAKAITKRGAIALVSGDIPAGAAVDLWYDGTQFQIQNVAIEPDYVVASGTNTYAITPSVVPTGYRAGLSYLVQFTNANTTAATLNVSGLGAKAITKVGSTALTSGDIPAGYVVRATYDGTQFQIVAAQNVTAASLGLDQPAAMAILKFIGY